MAFSLLFPGHWHRHSMSSWAYASSNACVKALVLLSLGSSGHPVATLEELRWFSIGIPGLRFNVFFFESKLEVAAISMVRFMFIWNFGWFFFTPY